MFDGSVFNVNKILLSFCCTFCTCDLDNKYVWFGTKLQGVINVLYSVHHHHAHSGKNNSWHWHNYCQY